MLFAQFSAAAVDVGTFKDGERSSKNFSRHCVESFAADVNAGVLYDAEFFDQDMNDLVKEQKARGIITSYDYPPPAGTNWLELLLPWLLMMNAQNSTIAAPAHTCTCGGHCDENHTQG